MFGPKTKKKKYFLASLAPNSNIGLQYCNLALFIKILVKLARKPLPKRAFENSKCCSYMCNLQESERGNTKEKLLIKGEKLLNKKLR